MPGRKHSLKRTSRRQVRPANLKKSVSSSDGLLRTGFALLLGRPNVGKSTLLNRLVGQHLAIVSPRPQTTRNRILGVVNVPGTQLCLLDSPGVHKAKGLLNRSMVQAATTAIQEVDIILYLVEAGWPANAEPGDPSVDVVGNAHRELLAEVARAQKPTILVLTKIDLIRKELLLPVTEAWSKAHAFQEIYPLSGLTGQNTDRFVDVVRKYLPEGPPLFPDDTITDQPERSIAAELIREQLFLQLREEIPYGVAVAIEQFDESSRDLSEADAPAGGLVRVEASIVVERESHKGIVIGARGAQLKKIGTESRKRIENMLGAKVWLGLHVRVVPGWTEKKGFLADLGYLGR